MKTLIIILLLCWPFGHRRIAPPAGHWEQTPHWQDGYWVKYTPEQMADKTGIKAWRQYPFSRFVWEWPGYKDSDRTWIVECCSDDEPDKPKQWKWIPAYNPFLPGQKYNL